MTTATQPTAARPSSAPIWHRLTCWSGIIFVPFFIVGMLMAVNSPDNDDSDAKVLSFYNDSGNRQENIIGMYLLVVAAVLFLVFAAGLGERIREAGNAVAARAASTLGTAFAALTMVGAITAAGLSANISLGDTPVPADADIFRQNLGYGLLAVGAALSAAAFIAVVTTAVRNTGLVPGWLIPVGYVLAVIELAGVFFLPMVALPIFVLIAAIVLLRRQGAAVR